MSFDEACTELMRHLLEKSGEARFIDLRQYWQEPPWAQGAKRKIDAGK
jgi:hypothetical protein